MGRCVFVRIVLGQVLAPWAQGPRAFARKTKGILAPKARGLERIWHCPL